MRAPRFWWQAKPSLIASLLRPLGALYGAITALRMRREGIEAPLPVLCIGNFVAGGAGKTPTAIAMAKHLLTQGETPFFLSRGYGGSTRGPCLVDLTRHQAKDVGDEALLLARHAPTIVGADRIAAARQAHSLGASLVILDDGLQNPQLRHDWRLAVVDGVVGIGNGLCLPAGPLRAPLSKQMPTVSALLFIEGGIAALEAASKPCLHARLRPDAQTAERYSGKKLVAFAGIGRPEKFKSTLEDLGARIVGWHPFADHHVYTLGELRSLQDEAFAARAQLVTTEKDLVRIGPALAALRQDRPLPEALPVELLFDNLSLVAELLERALRDRRLRD